MIMFNPVPFRNIGFIAQEVEKIYPELVKTDDEGYKSVAYSAHTPILVGAIKEQQKMINEQSKMISELKDVNTHAVSELGAMKDEISTLKKPVYESHATATEKLTASK